MRKPNKRDSFKDLLDHFRESEIYKKLRDQDDFETSAKVEIFNRDILDEATNYIHSDQMLNKARRRIINPANHFIFDFENKEDAVLFKLKFAGVALKSK